MIFGTAKNLELVAVYVVGVGLSTLKSFVYYKIIVAFVVTIRYFCQQLI